jgi:hypothetical protein
MWPDQKNQKINTFLNFFQYFENKWLLKLLSKIYRIKFSKTHFDASGSAKKHFFYDVTKVENFDKKYVTLSTDNQKIPSERVK